MESERHSHGVSFCQTHGNRLGGGGGGGVLKGEGTGYKTWSSEVGAAGDITPPRHPR